VVASLVGRPRSGDKVCRECSDALQIMTTGVISPRVPPRMCELLSSLLSSSPDQPLSSAIWGNNRCSDVGRQEERLRKSGSRETERAAHSGWVCNEAEKMPNAIWKSSR